MRALVTGAAGFIGSSIADRLLEDGHEVVGIDCFTDYYERELKEHNLANARSHDAFRFVEGDLVSVDLATLTEGLDAIFHQAAQAGVRASWGTMFESYTRHNVLATQRLLEHVRTRHERDVEAGPKVVYASSSSVYGDTDVLPMREDAVVRPFSPYGVTKLAAEHLCELYRHNYGLKTVSLRYFTVYGPRQRPDMAFRKFIELALRGEPLPVYGDGTQTRDFTFIDDIVTANLAAARGEAVGVYNLGGGSRVSLREVLATLGEVLGRDLALDEHPTQAGDVKHTYANTDRARRDLEFVPRTTLEAGLRAEAAWTEQLLATRSAVAASPWEG